MDSNLPRVHVGVVLGEVVAHPEFVLDTGFSGDLKIDEQTAKELGIVPRVLDLPFKNANGENVFAKAAHYLAEMEGRRAPVRILVINGMPLAGMGLFSVFGYRISIDCKNEEVYLERAA
jgi:predicted aspartyl protease